MDAIDRQVINALQAGFPLSRRPFAEAAAGLGLSEAALIRRLASLLERGLLSRFGPLYDAERLGGALTLAAMKLPPGDFERVAKIVNGFPEVAHNYRRDHAFNMWFVLATDDGDRIDEVISEIERTAGYRVYNMPRIKAFFIGARFDA